jgi:RimJ/RimL family protein N-acetyltransferase
VATHVRLRDVEEADLPTLFEHQRDPEANRMAVFDARSREDFDRHWQTILRDPSNVIRAIEVEGVLVGNIGSWVQDGERDVGYWIGRDHWGRGYATAALAALAQELPDRPLHAHVAVGNVGSIRVLEKCGFERVSVSTADDGVEELLFRLA